jgi:endo-1,4-beta-xylanase
LCQPAKRAGAIALIKNIQKDGTKIDGVGEQAHWTLTSPSLAEIEKTILDFSALGIKVAFSELDITVLPNPWDLKGADVNQKFEASEKMNPYSKGLPDSIQTQLAERYEAIFKLFLKHQDKISRVTFWGVNDGQSWLNDWPIKGRTNYPLLFDRDFKAKKAYNTVLGLKAVNK